MSRLSISISLVLLLFCGLFAARVQAAPPIELEVLVEQGAPLTAQQQWLKRLSELKLAGLTIRNARGGESPEIINRGTEDRPRYKITALLTSNEQLVVKGGSFGARDLGRLQQYFSTLDNQGVEGVTKRKTLFGLTDQQLIDLSKDFETPIDIETKGLPPLKILSQMAPKLKHKLTITGEAKQSILDVTPCRDELKRITAGSGLALLLRPYGLVMMPHTVGRDVEVEIVIPGAATESWPNGWPSEKRDSVALPALMEFINVEIAGIELPQALAALQERLEAPMLMDHNQLAKHGIEPEKIEVSVPSGRSYYKRILERVLFQARLKSEIRTDELGKPIIWITTIKN